MKANHKTAMRSDWRIIPLAVAACFLALTGYGGGHLKAEPNTFTLTVSLVGPGSGTVTSDDGGIACPPDCTEIYPEFPVTVLRAVAAPPSTFAGWGGDCAAAGVWPCEIIFLEADWNVSANFITTSSTNSAFEGKVKDSKTEEPIAGATVGASQGAVLVATTTADASGEYTLAVSDGTYDLTASAPGYLAQAETRTVGPNSTKQGINFKLTPQACSVPAARGYSRMIYDAQSGKVYLFGGFSKGGFAMDVLDVWAFDTEEKTWQLVGDQGSADWDALALDTQSRKVILYQPFAAEIETWAYDIDTNTWENTGALNPPPPRWGSRMAYDAESDVVVLFGGADLFTGEPLGDTWAYDYESNTWTNLQPPNSPPPHHFTDLVYHEAKDRIVMFGGFSTGGLLLNDTWTFDVNTNTWTELAPTTPPGPRLYHTLAYESRSEKIVMFGGVLDETNWPYEPTSNETWVFDLDSVIWTQEPPEKVASSRAWHQMVGAGNRVVLFGGGPKRSSFNNETYTYPSRTNNWKLITCDADADDDGGDDDEGRRRR